MDADILYSLELMLYGLGGVFASLTILYAAIKLLSKVFVGKDKPE